MRDHATAGETARVARWDGVTRRRQPVALPERLLALQRTAGNRAVGRLLVARQTATVPAQIEDEIAPWVADEMRKQPALRQVLDLVRELMGHYWAYVEQVTWIGPHGELLFKPIDQEQLRQALVAGGYTPQRSFAHRAVSLPGRGEQVEQIRSHAITPVSRWNGT